MDYGASGPVGRRRASAWRTAALVGRRPQAKEEQSISETRAKEQRQQWIEKPVENRLFFTKTGESGLDRFYRFLVNRPVKFKIFKILK
jgi:hypothetical protein